MKPKSLQTAGALAAALIVTGCGVATTAHVNSTGTGAGAGVKVHLQVGAGAAVSGAPGLALPSRKGEVQARASKSVSAAVQAKQAGTSLSGRNHSNVSGRGAVTETPAKPIRPVPPSGMICNLTSPPRTVASICDG